MDKLARTPVPAENLLGAEGHTVSRWDPGVDMVQVVMHPYLQVEFDAWVRARGLRVFPIPSHEDDLPTYGIGPA